MTSLQDLQETLDSLARRASENIGPKGKAAKVQNGLEINQNGYMSHAYRVVRKKWPLFENYDPMLLGNVACCCIANQPKKESLSSTL